MPVTNVGSRWSSGDLIFYEKNVSRAAIGNIFTIGDDAVTVGSATNDINFSWLGTTTGTFVLDAGAHTLAMTGLATTIGDTTTALTLSGSYTDGIVLSGTVADEAIQIGGTYDHGIRFTEDPQGGDVTNSFINVGDYTTGIAVVPTSANMFGVMHNVTMAVSVAYWYQAYYTKITTSGTTTSTSVAGHALRMMIGSNLAAVYGIQSHVVVSGARTFTSEVTAGSFYLDVGSTSVSMAGNRLNALQAVLIGSASVTTDNYCVAEFAAATNAAPDALVCIRQSSTVTSTAALWLELDGTNTYAIDFQGTVADAWTTANLTAEFGAFDEYVKIPVRVKGVTPTLYLVAAETWQSVD